MVPYIEVYIFWEGHNVGLSDADVFGKFHYIIS
jgi:hypothetical protein